MKPETESLIQKLNRASLLALESAAGLCQSRTNVSVEFEHWLLRLTESPSGDFARIFHRFDIDLSAVQRELNQAIDALPTGRNRTPTLSTTIDELIRQAWLLASIQFEVESIRPGLILLALLQDSKLGRLARGSSRELARIPVESLLNTFESVVDGSTEGDQAVLKPQKSSSVEVARVVVGNTPALDQFTVDLSERARSGRIDPVIGREGEIRQMVDILIRRRQNNPILTGEAGVGKTAIVEGLALRIARGDVPEPLRDVSLRTLDLGLLQAGAGIKGEFESRLKAVIEEVKASAIPIILFIDEAHTMIGAGGQAGQADAANLLKPALARGELRTIAATTWAEYKKYFEKDAALARRFQVVKVEEPTENNAVLMIRSLAPILETHHQVRILDEAVQASVKLSNRYLPARQLPDKCVSLLDTACARVAISRVVKPPAIENLVLEIEQIRTEIGILEREGATRLRQDSRITEKQAASAELEAQLDRLGQRWKAERNVVESIEQLSSRIELKHADQAGELLDESIERRGLRSELDAKFAELARIQGKEPLIRVAVDAQTIAEVLASWTGIPIGNMMADEIYAVLGLQEKLEMRVLGQSHALQQISERVQIARANLTDPGRPIGVFLLVGPSGVGKTETATALAELLHGGASNLITINMSEYQEAHTVSTLRGSPPGYIGYGEGGILTEAVRRKPHSVVLLDEIEKAHPAILKLFFQVFDKGVLDDGEGRETDFRNTIILLTSNLASERVMELHADTANRPDPAALAEALRPELIEALSPALLARMTLVPYRPISDEVMQQIIELQLRKIAQRIAANHRVQLTYDEEVVEAIARRCREVETGARNVNHILNHSLLPDLSKEFLTRMAIGLTLSTVHVSLDESGIFRYRFY